MIRLGLRSIVILAVIVGACASGENPSPGPTAPTPTPPPSAPPAPPPSTSCRPGAATDLRSTLVGGTRTLTWAAVPSATDYDVHVGSESGASDIIRDNTTHTNYTWTGAGSGTDKTFYLRVHSHNSCGSGLPSVELVFH